MNPRRRSVFGAVVAAVLCAPSYGFAQSGKVWRLGYLGVQSRQEGAGYYQASIAGLRALGYAEGKNLIVEARFAGGDYTRLPALAAELVQLKVDLILASSTPAATAAKRTTDSIPIVVAVTADPIGTGLVESFARPGGNVTGTASPNLDFTGKQIEFLQRLIPRLSRLGLMWNPGNRANSALLESFQTAARKAKIALFVTPVTTPSEITVALKAHAQERVDALVVLPDGTLLQHRRQIAEFATVQRMPSMYQLREHVEAGGLISYGQDLLHNHRLAATYVDRIFRGARPRELPIEQSSKFELVINGRTAKKLDIRIPKDMLLLVDKVIE